MSLALDPRMIKAGAEPGHRFCFQFCEGLCVAGSAAHLLHTSRSFQKRGEAPTNISAGQGLFLGVGPTGIEPMTSTV